MWRPGRGSPRHSRSRGPCPLQPCSRISTIGNRAGRRWLPRTPPILHKWLPTQPNRQRRQQGNNEMAHSTHARTLPADLGAPPVVDQWRMRSLIIGAVFSVIAAVLALLDHSIDHVLRAWVLGMVLTFGWSVGGLALLMVQYCSGGKWGLVLRRPLEAMTRSLPVVFIYWIVGALSQSRLYQWANHAIVENDFKLGRISAADVEAIDHA